MSSCKREVVGGDQNNEHYAGGGTLLNVRRFVELTLEKVDDWATIDQLLELADADGDVWTQEDTVDAVEKAKKAAIRNALRNERDGDGKKLFYSIEQPGLYGTRERVYKHQALLLPDERIQVAEYHSKRITSELAQVMDQRAWYKEQTGEEMPFPLNLERLMQQLV